MKAKEGSMGMFCRVGVDVGNLNNSTFEGAGCISIDPRKTRGRPARDTRKKMSGIAQRNLKNRTVLGKENMIAGRANKQSKECSRTIM